MPPLKSDTGERQKVASTIFEKLRELYSSDKDTLKKYTDLLYTQALLIEGLSVEDPVEFSNMIDKTLINNSNITFIIGGSDGLDDEIKNISNFKLSFSKMTFPHQLFRIILLEQIYRAFKIIHNESYHK
jgi:23S rRNA (pseudouridine1915-N3)-methyltransferase